MEDYNYLRDKIDRIYEALNDLKKDVHLLKYKSTLWGALGAGIIVISSFIIRKIGV